MAGLLDFITSKDPADVERRLRLAQGLSGMTTNPNAGLQAGIQSRLDGMAVARKKEADKDLSTNQRNATAAWLKANGHTELASGVMTGALTGAQAMSALKEQGPASVQSFKAATDGGFTGTFMDYQLALKKAGVPQPQAKGDTTWETESAKAHVGIFKNNIEASGQSRKTLMNTAILGQLGSSMDTGSIPVTLRKYFPEGVSAPLDAYNAMLTSTALSLKGKGTGPMTDKDFDNLLSTAGSISASPEARQIVQLALSENAKISLQIADISSQALSGTMDRLDATKAINKLMQTNPLTEEMNSRLGQIAGGSSGASLGDIDAEIARLEALRNN